MIPAFNAAGTIAETVRSVLAQAVPEDAMQIVVVDNASTDNTVAVVEQIAKSAARRVDVHRNPTNLGLVGNWNAALRMSRGEWVHILHADDYLAPGFYDAVQRLIGGRPDIDVCLVRALIVDGRGEPERLARRLGNTGDELLINSLAYGNEFYAPGVVVRRSAYVRVGGFSPVFAYVPDWEMWLRLLQHGKAVYLNDALACYRETVGNATNRLSRTAEDLRELVDFRELLAVRVPWFNDKLYEQFLKNHAAWAVRNWTAAANMDARRANYAYWRKFATVGEKLDEFLAVTHAYAHEARLKLNRVLRPWKR